MRNLTEVRSVFPSASLCLHYALIAAFMIAMGGGVVWYTHVEKMVATVDTTAKQVSGLALRLKAELPQVPDVESKLSRIQSKAEQMQSTVNSIAP